MRDATPPPSTAARLQLLSCRGVPAAAVLALDGQSSSLQAIAELSPVAVPEETEAALRECRVEPVAGTTGTQWWLRNLGSSLRCMVNASSLAAGEALPLRDGDLIELGLVQIGFQSGTPEPRTATAAGTAAGTATPPPGASAFRLTDLGQLAAPASWQPSALPAGDAPFAGILDAFDGHAAASPPRNTAPLAPAPATPDTEEGPESIGVMEALHRQYLRLMQNPNDPQMAGRWAAPDVAVRPQAPSFDELRKQAASRDLYDILGHGAAIDPILQRLDTLSEHDILRPPAPVDVLRLFAPADRPGADAELPGLTRRDHHGITADSAMRLQAGAAPSAADPAAAPSSRTEPRP